MSGARTVTRKTPPPRADSGTQDATTVLARLQSFISDEQYAPGKKLPAERMLAVKLHVGRPALREALKALTMLDIIESRRGDGTYLKAPVTLYTGAPIKAALDTTDINMLELLEIRKMMEPRAAYLAAVRADEAALRKIEQARLTCERSVNQWARVIDADYQLHAAILHASGNSLLEQLHRYLAPLLRKSRQIHHISPLWKSMCQDHARIVEAIIRGEPENAERAMTEHLHHIGHDLISRPVRR